MQLSYSRRKKKTYKQGSKRKKSLLYLLEKGLGLLQNLLNKASRPLLEDQEMAYLKTIKKVLIQHKWMQQNPGKSVKDRIVSLVRPYVRPIVKGKRTNLRPPLR